MGPLEAEAAQELQPKKKKVSMMIAASMAPKKSPMMQKGGKRYG